MVEEVLAMFAQSGPMRDPLLEKIGPRQIDRTIEIRAAQEQNQHQLQLERLKSDDRFATKMLLFLGFVLLAVFGLCWLFLYFDKTDQVFNLITLLFTGGGGVGIGMSIKRARQNQALTAFSEDDPNPR